MYHVSLSIRNDDTDGDGDDDDDDDNDENDDGDDYDDDKNGNDDLSDGCYLTVLWLKVYPKLHLSDKFKIIHCKMK